ncbi:MAG: type VI secretion system tip protein VgrG [Bryobacterales bacterium]|nr:type VI secretion system tip protein VgrG [Bryobacterales bacterium]
MNHSQKHQLHQLLTPLGPDRLLLDRYECTESISEPYELRIRALAEDNALPVADLVGQPCAVRTGLDHQKDDETQGNERYFHGVVRDVATLQQDRFFRVHELTVVPSLWFLSLTTNCRIFQRKSAREIVAALLEENGIRDVEWRLLGDVPVRRYCVQYRESNLTFVHRLLEEEGIHYFFKHLAGAHRLVLSDSKAAPQCPSAHRFRFAPEVSEGYELEEIRSISHHRRVSPGVVTLRDFDFYKPSMKLEALESDDRPAEKFVYPGNFFRVADGERQARHHLEEQLSLADEFRGLSHCRTFTAGHAFELTGHLSNEFNQEYRLIRVTHFGQNSTYRSDSGEGSLRAHYRNEFMATPLRTIFRPARVTPRPAIHGTQSATVVGPRGEEIHTDEYGRVKVRFHWDREVTREGESSCWLRVSQAWAGKNWGALSIPRIGQEVLVSFLEGDPDRPVIVGRLYNEEMRPPFDLPGGANNMGLRSKSVHGDGYNEISVNDTNGNEGITIHAQHNMGTRVENDDSLSVGNNQQVGIGSNQMVAVGANQGTEVGENIRIKAGQSILLEAGTSITLKCGASVLHMNQAGLIFLSGSIVNVAGTINTNVTAPLTTVSGLAVAQGAIAHFTGAGFSSTMAGTVAITGADSVRINS